MPLIQVLFLVFISSVIKGGELKGKDELYQDFRNAKHDTDRVNALISLTRHYYYLNNDSIKYFADVIAALSEKANYTKGKGYALRYYGMYYWGLGDYKTAVEYYQKGIAVANSPGTEALLAGLYVDNAIALYGMYNLQGAIKYYSKGIQLFSQLHDTLALSSAYGNLANTYEALKMYDKALYYQQQNLKIYREKNMLPGLAATLHNMGLVYHDKGDNKQARMLIDSAMAMNRVSGNKYYLIANLTMLALIYSKDNPQLKTYTELRSIDPLSVAIKYMNECVALSKEVKDITTEAESTGHLGELYLKAKNPLMAEPWVKKAIELADEHELPQVKADALTALAEIYTIKNMHKEAAEVLRKRNLISDSLYNEDLKQQLINTQKSFEVEQRDNDIRLLQVSNALKQEEIRKKNQLKNIFIISTLMFLGLTTLVLVAYRGKYRTSKKLEQTVAVLKTTQHQLVEQEKLASLGQLTAGIAHEIQNPLNFVTNFAELSTELINEVKYASDESDKKSQMNELENNLVKITHHAKRADVIVKNMLLLNRAGNRDKQLTDINALCDDAVNALKNTWNHSGINDISIEKNYAKDLPQILMVSLDIFQVIINLLDNAHYAVKSRMEQHEHNEGWTPLITISTFSVLKGVEIEKAGVIIKDNGTGIAKANRDKIFQPFFTMKKTGEGTGLGLSICHSIITANGGDISFTSEENNFTAFQVTLPVHI